MSARDEIVRAITHVQAGSLDCRKGGLAEQAADASLAALRADDPPTPRLPDPFKRVRTPQGGAMRLLIWLLSRKRQKPRPPGWSIENQELWDPREAAEVRTEIQKQKRRELGKETP